MCTTLLAASPVPAPGQTLTNTAGVQLAIDRNDTDPVLRVVLPGASPANQSFIILFPEHLSVRRHGATDAEHLYLFQPGTHPQAPAWKRTVNTLSYTSDYAGIGFTAQATLQNDGILFTYTFANHSPESYDAVWAITDPRFKTVFYDPRLERTWVHHTGGLGLLASETPERFSMPLDQWFPARYHAQFTAPVPPQRVQHREDGITYYYKSRPVDLPFIATVSADGKWVAASFSRNTGNVWSNPELTCQHVDPQVSLPAHQTATYQVKFLLIQGTLYQALAKAIRQRPDLKQSP